jgi:hypothetical protein
MLGFIAGVAATVLVQVFLALKYMSRGDSAFYTHHPPPPFHTANDVPIKVRQAIHLEPIPDPELVCACCTDAFDELLTGSESKLSVLQRFLKDAIAMDRDYAAALGKLGEASLLSKLVKKQFMFKGNDAMDSPSWMSIKATVNGLGQKLEQDARYVSAGIANNLKVVSKSCRERLKELNLQFREASESFISTTLELKEVLSKLAAAKRTEEEAERNYDGAKREHAQFGTLVKLEMHAKIARNVSSTLNSKLHEVRGRISTTAAGYLPKMQLLHQEFRKMQHLRNDSVKGCLESWASILEDNLTQSIEVWRALKAHRSQPEEVKEESFSFKGLLSKAIPALATESQRDKLNRDIEQITGFFKEIKTFIKCFIKTETKKAADVKKLADYELQMEDEGLQEGWRDFSVQLSRLSEVSEHFIGEMEVARGSYASLEQVVDTLTRMRKSEMSDMQAFQEYIGQAAATRDECSELIKAVVLRSFEHRLLDAKRTIIGLDRSLDAGMLSKETTDFTPLARDHRAECPCYKVEASEREVSSEEETRFSAVSESCQWFTEMLSAFVQEWGCSDKFKAYACKRFHKVFNKKRPRFLSEIIVLEVDVKEPAPDFKDFTPLSCEAGDFFHEVQVSFKGQVRIHLAFELDWSLGKIPFDIVVVFRALQGRLRFFFTPCHRGRSFYSFATEPSFQIALEPVIGRDNKLVLGQYPQLTTFLLSILTRKVHKYVWPNTRSLKIPKSRASR